MPVYGVVMTQGVSANLNGNTLYTGSMGDAADALQSCSAVALCNSVTRMGGLYHFPAGSINSDTASRTILQAIATTVNPDRAFIAFGVASFLDHSASRPEEKYGKTDPGAVKQAGQHQQLCSFVQDLIPRGCALSRRYATGGHAELGWNANGPVFEIDNQPDAIIDLRSYAAGTHGAIVIYR